MAISAQQYSIYSYTGNLRTKSLELFSWVLGRWPAAYRRDFLRIARTLFLLTYHPGTEISRAQKPHIFKFTCNLFSRITYKSPALSERNVTKIVWRKSREWTKYLCHHLIKFIWSFLDALWHDKPLFKHPIWVLNAVNGISLYFMRNMIKFYARSTLL